MALTVMRVSQVYTYPPNYQIVYIKYVHLCTCLSYLNSCHSLLVASHFNISSSLSSKALNTLSSLPASFCPLPLTPLLASLRPHWPPCPLNSASMFFPQGSLWLTLSLPSGLCSHLSVRLLLTTLHKIAPYPSSFPRDLLTT